MDRLSEYEKAVGRIEAYLVTCLLTDAERLTAIRRIIADLDHATGHHNPFSNPAKGTTP